MAKLQAMDELEPSAGSPGTGLISLDYGGAGYALRHAAFGGAALAVDGSADWSAVLEAASAWVVSSGGGLIAGPGIYGFDDDAECVAPLTMQPGAVFRPASGEVVTISGSFQGSPGCLDTSAGGSFAFGAGSVAAIDAIWFADPATALNDAVDSAPTGATIRAWSSSYTLSDPLTLSQPAILSFGVGTELNLASGYAANHIIEISSHDVQVVGPAVLDGDGLPLADTPYVGGTPPVGLGVYIHGTPEDLLENVRVEGLRVTNCPASGIFATRTDGLRLSGVLSENCCHQIAMTPPGAVTVMGSRDPVLLDVRVYEPGMKGVYFSNCEGGGGTIVHVIGTNSGHASLFTAACQDMSFSQVYIEGEGAGVKHDRAYNIVTSLSIARGGSTAFQVQGGKGVQFVNCISEEPSDWGFWADAHPTYGEPISDILFFGCVVRRAPDTYNSGQRAFGVQARSAMDADNISFIHCEADGAYYGIQCLLQGTGIIHRLTVRGGSYTNLNGTGLVARGSVVDIDGVYVKTVGTATGIQISNGGAPIGEFVSINNAKVWTEDAFGIYLVNNLNIPVAKITNNQVSGASAAIISNLAITPYLSVRGNQISNNVGTNGITITARTDMTTTVDIADNMLPGKRVGFTNGEYVNGYVDNNVDSSLLANRPVQVEPYRGNGSPEGVVTAFVGRTYHRGDGGNDSTLYIKAAGSGNTGWRAITTVAP